MKKWLIIIAISLTFGYFFILYFSNLAPRNALSASLNPHSDILQELAPQGFGFYSKSPTEERIMFDSENLVQLPNARPQNLFGLSRYGRAQAIELGRIYEGMSTEYFEKCENKSQCEDIISNLTPYEIKKNPELHHLEKGEYLISIEEPMSWYFREFKDTTSFERKIARIVVE